jgi:type IV secretory pathway VirB10-like protein
MKLRQHASLAKILTLTQSYPALVLLLALGVGGVLTWLFLVPKVTPMPRQVSQPAPPQGIPSLKLAKAVEESDVVKLSRTNKALQEQVEKTQADLTRLTQAQQQATREAREREAKQHDLIEAALRTAQRDTQQATQQAIQKAVQDATAAQQRAAAAKTPAKTEPPKQSVPATLIRQAPEVPRLAPHGSEGQDKQRRLIRSADMKTLAGSPPPLNRVDTPYLLLGSFAAVRVVTGVAATSRENGALPVLLSVVGPFHPPYQLHGPGRNSTATEIAMHGCFLMGKAQANMASGRADIELEWLSCVMPNLMAYEREIKGYVAGVDMRFGLPGYVESHESAVLAKVFLTSLLAGAAEAFKLARQTVVVTPFGGTINTVTGNAGEVAGFSALANASAQLSAYYLQQASRLMPTIIVDAGSPGAAVLQEPLLLEDFPTRMLVAAR